MLPRTIHRIQSLARRPIEKVSIKDLLARTTNLSEEAHLEHALWLRQQVPIRLAHRLSGFLDLPYVVFCNTRFHEVFQLFNKTFQAVADVEPFKNADDVKEFAQLIRSLHREHAELINMLQEGYGELKALLDGIDLEIFLNKTLSTRIGNRVLAEHFLQLHDHLYSDGSGGAQNGIVDAKCHPAEVIQELNDSLGQLFYDVYGIEPVVVIQGQKDTELSFVREHLKFMLQEIMKNAMRATIETHLHARTLPPVTVEIMKGSYDVTLKVSDQGGGMTSDQLRDVWRYGCTTANDSASEDAMYGGGIFSGLSTTAGYSRRSIAGYGFGLPLSRVYAQYFGGDIIMQSMPGYGSDVYLNINHLDMARTCASTSIT